MRRDGRYVDRYTAVFVPPTTGRWELRVEAGPEPGADDAPREHTLGQPQVLDVERPRAAVGAWYSVFPRSTGGYDATGSPRHGTLATTAADLPRVAALGFDVVHLTPIHPIGRVGRKGAAGAAQAHPDDPGCPWAVGSSDGGHDTVHPDLGTVDDLRELVGRAREVGLEVAMELVLHCSPDHPWITRHPEWFNRLPDGRLQSVDQPGGGWSDVVAFDLDTPDDALFEQMYAEILSTVIHWVDCGVTLFRVDNPHTKPADLWHRLIRDLRSRHPDVVLLAEAFTRPSVQRGLSRLGFSQTLTYFMWRHGADEVTTFGQDLVTAADEMRPNLFPANHDVLPDHLQHAGPAMFASRAALAATLSPSWGIPSGYEICENEPAHTGSHRWHRSEKFELRARDWQTARQAGMSIERWITLLNAVRRRHPALQRLRSLRFHPVNDRELVAYSKIDPCTGDVVLCVVDLAPGPVRTAIVDVTAEELGLTDGAELVDELTGASSRLQVPLRVRIDPEIAVATVLAAATNTVELPY